MRCWPTGATKINAETPPAKPGEWSFPSGPSAAKRRFPDDVGDRSRPTATAVEEFGRPLVGDPARVGTVTKLGVDETSYKAATPDRATQYATGMIDLDRRIVIDLIEGRQGTDLRRWLLEQPAGWPRAVKVVATDLTDAYRTGMTGLLDHARKVADPFHVVTVHHEAPCLRGRLRGPPCWAVAAEDGEDVYSALELVAPIQVPLATTSMFPPKC